MNSNKLVTEKMFGFTRSLGLRVWPLKGIQFCGKKDDLNNIGI